MRVERFGVVLERLEPRHLETVRRWRNGDWVRPFMRYRALVDPQGHVRWFGALAATTDWYFLAATGGTPFGMFHVKAIDWDARSGEAGGFVGAPVFIGRPEPAQAVLALMDFAFLLLGLRVLEAQYRPDLPRVARFNEQLGYEVYRSDPDGFARARVARDRYLEQTRDVRHAAARLHGPQAELVDPGAWLVGHLAADGTLERSGFRLRQP